MNIPGKPSIEELKEISRRYYIKDELLYSSWTPDRPIGHLNGKGYIQVEFHKNRKRYIYRAHHIVWFIRAGEWPEFEIDHIDRNKSNYKFNNLRRANSSINSLNQGRDRKLPHGVSQNKQGMYFARMWIDGRSVYLGSSWDIEIARDIYLNKYKEIYKEELAI